MDFTPDEKDRIRDLVLQSPFAGETPEEQLRLLTTRPVVANPDPPHQVPKPIDRQTLLSKISSTSQNKTPDSALTAVSERIRENDHVGVVVWIERARGKFWITEPERLACLAVVNEKIDDPHHPAIVEQDSPLETELGRRIAGLTLEALQEITDAS